MKSIGNSLIAIALGLSCLTPVFAAGASRTKTTPADASGVSNVGIAQIGAKVCTTDNTNCYNSNNESGYVPPGTICGMAVSANVQSNLTWGEETYYWTFQNLATCHGVELITWAEQEIIHCPPGFRGLGAIARNVSYGANYGSTQTAWCVKL